MRLTEEQRRHTEGRIRAASDRMLRGEISHGRQCDVKTLAIESGVSRAALYGTYRHLKDDFERRRNSLRQTGEFTDPRDGEIANLKKQLDSLRSRVADQQRVITEHEAFRGLAVSRLVAQHDEIMRLRCQANAQTTVHIVRSPERGQK